MTDNPTEIRVVSAVADKKQAILYLEDGTQLVIKQGDHRLGDLLEVIIPINTRGEIAVVSLNDFSIYAAFEKKSAGLTKFFKLAKTKVVGFFGGKADTHETHIPEEGKAAILRAVKGETMTEEHVMEHGKPIDITDEVGPEEVVVAVVTTPAQPATETKAAEPARKTVIPGIQNLKPLIDHAVKTNSVGVQAFLNRCAKFIDQRQHSVDDLMRFLEKGDLPLADDGSIIAYKMLNKAGDGNGEVFVDCHSGKIRQRVGSYVCVNENLVDLNRRTECSNGLHIARRGYLRSFSGSVCVLTKIDPEDVMVVPHNDANKVRVKGYHILGVLSDEATRLLKSGTPMTSDEDALSMVFNAIRGQHIDRIERVQVNGQMGTNVVITKLKHDASRAKQSYDHTRSDLNKAAALDDDANLTGAIDPRDINKRVMEEHGKMSGNNPDTVIPDEIGLPEVDLEGDEDGLMAELNEEESEEDLLDQALNEANEIADGDLEATAEMHDEIVERLAKPEPEVAVASPATVAPTGRKAEMAEYILDFQTSPTGDLQEAAARKAVALKKASKVGWEKLGVDKAMSQKLEIAALMDAGMKAEAAQKEKPKPEAGTKEKKAAAKKAKTAPPENFKTQRADEFFNGKPTKADEARALFVKNDIAGLRAFKKRVKKGWETLGFSESEITRINSF